MGSIILSCLKFVTLWVLVLLGITACDRTSDPIAEVTQKRSSSRPNILLIVVDDLGYSDLGVYGGEIETPNLDKLARSGMQMTSFYAAPTCSPTRSMLLSGTDNHIAGLGTMGETIALTDQYDDVPGYEGYLNFRVAALPELMRDAGYHTYMAGKWHLGREQNQGPAARGFEQSFSILQGGGSHFDRGGLFMGDEVSLYRDGDELVENLPEDFYSTRFYTERMIDYIDSNHVDGKPFFGYLAYTAPHWPLMAPDESIAKYKGRYSAGYSAIGQQRLARMKTQGLITKNENTGVKLPVAWEQLSEEERAKEARAMEIYAAMVDDLDRYIGQLMAHLESIGELDNTLILFMSDNGAEGHDFSQFPPASNWVAKCCDNSLENMGKVNSYVWYGPTWASVSSTPLGGSKGSPLQGGIRVPAFMVHPEIAGKQLNREPLTVMDIMPTILDVAGIEHPAPDYKGRPVVAMRGQSMWPMLKGDAHRTHPENYVVARELFGKRSVQQGDWSIVSLGKPWDDGAWKLYNLAEDISQTRDLAGDQPEVLVKMERHWEQYQAEVGVIMPTGESDY